MAFVFQDLLILMIVVWASAVALKRLGLPTIMGELLAQMGIFRMHNMIL